MPEYKNVEKPFLDKLRQLGWEVVDQGIGIPQDPEISLRKSFREIILSDVLKESVKNINLTTDGKKWLTDKQLESILFEIQRFQGKSLHDANKEIHHLLLKGITIDKNELTGEQNPVVRLIDYKNYQNNSFIAINQFRIITPGASREGIIPDIVLFLNGLPVVVIEAKDFDVAEPLSEAYIQIARYSNTRDDEYGYKEGEEKLFHYNIFNIITHGTEARAGTISADFDFYNNWVDIFPEEYKTIQISPGEERQEVLIHGMLNREILVDILKHFTIFMEVKKGFEVKIVARYNQYRAVGKIIKNLHEGKTLMDKSGVVWHTQGSGKSLTMVFLVKKMRSDDNLKGYKVIFVVDRHDLESQLSETADLTGEPVRIIEKKNKLNLLSDDTGDVNMVMIHKFFERDELSAKSLIEAGIVPVFEKFESVNDSDKILLLIDEAHRSQGGDMGDNLFNAFENASRIGFTGTPLITERHKIKTNERFHNWIDFYKFDRAVTDRATVEIKYIGKNTDDFIDDKEIFDAEFEDMFKKRTQKEREEIQRRYGNMIAYLESKERIAKISKDIIEHYYNEILINGFKAQVVGSSIVAAVRYKFELEKVIKNKIEELKSQPEENIDPDRVKQLEFLKVAAIVSSLGNNEPGFVSEARKQAHDMNAIENFKEDFKYDKSETGIGIICVCDRLLTGFDAPIEQVMYLDKIMREHDLFQAIARVNRTRKGKSYGLIVDYIGITKHLKDALGIYTDSDQKSLEEFLNVFRDINKEIPVLEARYNRIINLFKDYNLNEIDKFLKQEFKESSEDFDFAEECIEKSKNVKFRAELLAYSKGFFNSLDLLFNTQIGMDYWIPAKRLGYLIWRIKDRYCDKTMDLKWASMKVRRLIDKHLQSIGIDTRIEKVSILSDDFKKKVDNLNKTPKAKASEMEHAIRWHIKVNLDKDPSLYNRFKDRLENLLNKYKDNWDEIVKELNNLHTDIKDGRKEKVDGIPVSEAPFYELLKEKLNNPNAENVDKLKIFFSKIMIILKKAATIKNIWNEKPSERKKYTGSIEDIIRYSNLKGISERNKELSLELMNLAEIREKDLK